MSQAQAQTQTNVDPREIGKFEELAHRWWDTDGEFRPLHEINPLRLGFIETHSGGLDGKRVLDVGCGGGILAEAMAACGATVTGIDMGEAPLSVARLHGLESGLKVDYQQITAEALAAHEPGSYDVVTCMEMLEHVPDPESVVQACATLAKPDGHLFFSTLNRNPKSFLLAIVGAEYLMRMLPRGTHEYRRFIRPSELDAAIRAADLHTAHLTGMSYNPLTRQYRLGDDVSVNYLVHAVHA
ncbi:bifunctional 2-polyprenyl-6-hydroxyphenol methylase/3-demethylubiquinol 3-O-methyltransferase UbiG [Acidihalobacter ferrooxydans]|uniref:Ubiquinone biosynthesis O-methyltransferase n=1 Tax=Acidihalobacter ferrooxydans TaxID=1765967 RepID=A0A1P8UG62_9GAMM|nr:bifunctional 2-polyprenyl-6-hydroxyphenol methylase/3-demethylubiquinol 3-O-methyltransferase UbiG [Acidihalobacter ferrooxydans]APZ42819.1 bifunctional 3-demethylubiquinol 3-O-methyltransferase/2-polyprenyl-6-hydroxyphenol methylase [Acidihalobacter ferrooxydans]